VNRAAVFALGSLVLAAPVTEPQVAETPFSAHGAFIALSVADVAASARWYREKLGLRVVLEPPRAGEAAAVILEGGGLLVELVQHDAAKPLGALAPGARGGVFVHGYFKAGLMVDDFDGTMAALRARGVEIAYGPYAKTATMRANAIIRDNAGNLIQFFGR
jgi:catechol 2,3-dioxygenase-like lactoylglutathione lyase family enzyme